MPKRKRKTYSRPKKLFDKPRIEEENILVSKYGLKNKREIWRANYAIEKMRGLAKKLITAPEEDKQEFLERLKAKGFDVVTIADVLGLNNEDYLKRRLQSVVVKKQLSKAPKQARQFITHRHIKINGKVVNSPSHLTTLEEESAIELDLKLPTKKEDKLTKEEKEFLAATKGKEVEDSPFEKSPGVKPSSENGKVEIKEEVKEGETE